HAGEAAALLGGLAGGGGDVRHTVDDGGGVALVLGGGGRRRAGQAGQDQVGAPAGGGGGELDGVADLAPLQHGTGALRPPVAEGLEADVAAGPAGEDVGAVRREALDLAADRAAHRVVGHELDEGQRLVGLVDAGALGTTGVGLRGLGGLGGLRGAL